MILSDVSNAHTPLPKAFLHSPSYPRNPFGVVEPFGSRYEFYFCTREERNFGVFSLWGFIIVISDLEVWLGECEKFEAPSDCLLAAWYKY